jgi:hypothetical protein
MHVVGNRAVSPDLVRSASRVLRSNALPIMAHRDIETSEPAAHHPEITEGRKVVAAIGIDRYTAWPRLDNAVRDARGTLAAFQRLGFEPIVEPLLDGAATAAAIRRLVNDDLATLGSSDSLVVFFAGHGHTQTRTLQTGPVRTGYLIPFDGGATEDQSASWLEIEAWLRDVSRIPARHILVILDACKSGIALDSLDRFRGSGSSGGERSALRRRQSRHVITSALSDQRASDSGPIAGHSLFTGWLIEAITGGLARGGLREVTGSEIGHYLQRQVAAATDGDQTPDIGAFHRNDRGELVLRLADASPTEPGDAAPAIASMVVAGEDLRDEPAVVECPPVLVVVMALICFAPVGIALAWWYRLWSPAIRVAVSGTSAAIFVAALASAW